MKCSLEFSYLDDNRISRKVGFACVENYNEALQKSVTSTPIISLSADDTFALETGSGMEISARFSRRNPTNPDDSSTDMEKWSNAKWYLSIASAVDRWQMRSDGFKLDIVRSEDNPYVPPRYNINGYIASVSLDYRKGDPTVITGNLQFSVGRMYIQNKRATPLSGPVGDSMAKDEFTLTMSDSSRTNWYYLISQTYDVDCISSFSLTGGMECPFEVLVLEIPRSKLQDIAPNLVNDIVAGRNKIQMNGMGRSDMTVVKVRSGKNYRITAYCDAEVLKGQQTTQTQTMFPFDWIKDILTSGKYLDAYAEGDTFLYSFDPKESMEDQITFPEGTNIWRILQICAMYLRCKIFFADGKVYLADCTAAPGTTSSKTSPLRPITDYYAIDLTSQDRKSSTFGAMLGSVSLGDEGLDTVMNAGSVSCKNGPSDDESTKKIVYTFPGENEVTDSITAFGRRDFGNLSIPELIQNPSSTPPYNQADTFLRNLVIYRDEPQQSITFTLKEMRNSTGGAVWESTFAPMSRIEAIASSAENLMVSSSSQLNVGETKPQKLMLSTYVRNYPEGTTTYTFGQISGVDLASSTSEISSAIGN